MNDKPEEKPKSTSIVGALEEIRKQAQALQQQSHSQSGRQINRVRVPDSKPETMDEKIRKQKIENDNIEKDQSLKKYTLISLFIFLGVETIVVFALAFFQGFELAGFNLDVWSFRIIVVATLGQITAMLSFAVRHLFPIRKE